MGASFSNPVGALRERLRSIAHAVGETRQYVVDGQAALSAQVEALRNEIGRNRVADDVGRGQIADIDVRLAQVEAALNEQHTQSVRLHEMARAICDREPLQRERLRALRASDGYLTPFAETEPLVSVVIPTFDNHQLLRERAIPSILAQSYQHFEVVVVGDAAPDEARAAVESFGDARLRYSNLAYRGPYPSDPLARRSLRRSRCSGSRSQIARTISRSRSSASACAIYARATGTSRPLRRPNRWCPW